ncbi:MAG TPA: LpqB family beta-propeller domain-containing protein [Jiangellaceae bacterium]|nr:LpqB family beta-propeller domain-containing protein [Jiangellaceae bacterium]
MARPVSVAGVVLAACGLLVGCAELPTSGPVVAGNPVRQQQEPPYVSVKPQGPVAEADQVDVVDGYLNAMSSYEPGYDTARMFLTPDAAAAWDPAAGITVHDDAGASVDLIAGGAVRVSFDVSGTVGADGSYSASAAPTPGQLTLDMEQVEGEWRIANPAPGIVVSDYHFDREFEAHNLYFFDPGFDVLVPDPIYLPVRGQTTTILAQALLRGPSSWLAPGVRSAFPDGTELAVSSVPVESGTAIVELSAEASDAGPEQREQMAAQLAWTLGDLPQVDQVAVNSDGIPLPPDSQAVSLRDVAEYDPAVLRPDSFLYGVGATGVVALGDEGQPEPVAGPFGAMPDVREVAVNPGGNRAAVVDATGREVRIATFGENEPVETVVTGSDLASLSWDRNGLIWLLDRAAPDPGLIVLRPGGEPVVARAGGLAGHDVERLAVSLDGTRVALVMDGAAYVGVVIRESDTADEVRVDNLRRIGPDRVATDIVWTAPDRVAVLLRGDGAAPEAHVLLMSGVDEISDGPVREAVGLAGAPLHDLVVGTSDNRVLAQQDAALWVEIGQLGAPAYPG